MDMKKTSKFRMEIGEPVVVAQAEPGDQVWGHFQFPRLSYTETGAILAEWEYTTDTIEYDGVTLSAVSEDGGRTWREKRDSDRLHRPLMKNGKYFGGFVKKGAYPVDYLDAYTPVQESGENKRFFAEDIEETTDTVVYAREICPETGEETVFPCTVRWPYQPIGLCPGKRVYPCTMIFALCNRTGLLELDGDLYYVLYTNGFDAEADSREKAVHDYVDFYGVYVFRSVDCGRTWEYQSEILVDADTFNPAPSFEGLGEPMMRRMPDGSVVMLMRTGSRHPSYIARSTDRCRSWSKPQRFDDIGVFPQLLVLDCGVTLASYGRPVLKLRATSDPAGMCWGTPVELELSNPAETNGWKKSCFYTGLLALSDREALLIYSDFQYPNGDGIGVKSILTRKITVIADPVEL